MSSSLYRLTSRTMVSLTDVVGFRSDPVPESLINEMIGIAGSNLPSRFSEPPWRFVVVVGEEREQLITRIAEALARHWGLGPPRGLASDRVLSAPAFVIAFSSVSSSEAAEALGIAAGAVQNLILLAHAAGLGTHRIYSPHLVPESVLDFVGSRLGPEIRRSELVAMVALGYPTSEAAPAPPVGPVALWIGRPGDPEAPEEGRADGAGRGDPGFNSLDVKKPAALLRASGSERVLVVDPYPYNRDLLAAHLVAAGYQVEVYTSGEDLLAAAARHEPDLIIISESTSDSDGLQLVRRLRAPGGARVPIVVTTRRRDSAFRIGGLNAGVDYYLRKPIHPIELYTAAHILLERRRLVEKLQSANQEFGRLLDELRATQARLVQQAKMASLGELVAGVAHEINTPLGAVVSNNDLFLRAFGRLRRGIEESGFLRSAGAGPSAQLGQIKRDLDAVTVLGENTRLACQRIVGIVRSLRTFARLDEAEVKAVDLHEGLESTLVLIAHLQKTGITVERHYAPDLPAVDCHPNQINQVFMNLLVNACQAIESSPGAPFGTITLETLRADESHVRIAISDTGRGIPEEHLTRIFDPGFTTKGVGVGTGLGLSICYQIMQAHGGDIAVQSTPGHGARFVLTLPIAAVDAPRI